MSRIATSMQQLFMQESLAVLIGATRRRIKQVAWEMLRPWKITPQQSGVLLVLYTEGTQSLTQLAARIWCDSPTACRIVNKLIQRGLVTSCPHLDDRRRADFALTLTGTSLGRELLGTANGLASAIEAGLSADERALVRRLLKRIMANMDALPGAVYALGGGAKVVVKRPNLRSILE